MATVCSVSPDKMYVAITTGQNTYIYSAGNFSLYHELKGEKIVSLVWRDNGSLILGGERNVTRLTLANYASETLFPSSAKKAWWNADGEIVLANGVDQDKFILNESSGLWRQENLADRKPNLQNANYRVFCGKKERRKPAISRLLFLKARGKPSGESPA